MSSPAVSFRDAAVSVGGRVIWSDVNITVASREFVAIIGPNGAGQSTLIIQGTAGTDECAIRYGWNYARLLTEGPSPAARVVSPLMQAMQHGKLARIYELPSSSAVAPDTLYTILPHITLPMPAPTS